MEKPPHQIGWPCDKTLGGAVGRTLGSELPVTTTESDAFPVSVVFCMVDSTGAGSIADGNPTAVVCGRCRERGWQSRGGVEWVTVGAGN